MGDDVARRTDRGSDSHLVCLEPQLSTLEVSSMCSPLRQRVAAAEETLHKRSRREVSPSGPAVLPDRQCAGLVVGRRAQECRALPGSASPGFHRIMSVCGRNEDEGDHDWNKLTWADVDATPTGTRAPERLKP